MNRRILSTLLLAAALLLFAIGVASADLKPTYILNSWDDKTERYENGNLIVYLNGEWHPFYTRLDFDTDLHPDACGTGSLPTRWAGDTFVGLYNVDTNGAPGWQETRNFALVNCSAFDDPTLKTINFDPPSDQVLAICDEAGSPAVGEACVLSGTKDTPVPCQPGNCTTEIQTNFHVTLNTDCDQADTIDKPFIDAYAGEGVCLYWEARKPTLGAVNWTGNMQARYYAANDPHGGDKTINFSVEKPLAVTLSDVKAVALANPTSLAALAGGALLAAVALFVWRRKA